MELQIISNNEYPPGLNSNSLSNSDSSYVSPSEGMESIFQQNIDFEDLFTNDMATLSEVSDLHNIIQELDGLLPVNSNVSDPFNFDLSEFLLEEFKPQRIIPGETIKLPDDIFAKEIEPKTVVTGERKIRAGVKKIDMEAKKYVIDNDNDEDDGNGSNISDIEYSDDDDDDEVKKIDGEQFHLPSHDINTDSVATPLVNVNRFAKQEPTACPTYDVSFKIEDSLVFDHVAANAKQELKVEAVEATSKSENYPMFNAANTNEVKQHINIENCSMLNQVDAIEDTCSSLISTEGIEADNADLLLEKLEASLISDLPPIESIDIANVNIFSETEVDKPHCDDIKKMELQEEMDEFILFNNDKKPRKAVGDSKPYRTDGFTNAQFPSNSETTNHSVQSPIQILVDASPTPLHVQPKCKTVLVSQDQIALKNKLIVNTYRTQPTQKSSNSLTPTTKLVNVNIATSAVTNFTSTHPTQIIKTHNVGLSPMLINGKIMKPDKTFLTQTSSSSAQVTRLVNGKIVNTNTTVANLTQRVQPQVASPSTLLPTLVNGKLIRQGNGCQSLLKRNIMNGHIPLSIPVQSPIPAHGQSLLIQNRRVLNELPQTNTSQINDTRKRKGTELVPAISNKKLILEIPLEASRAPEKTNSNIGLDHNYCKPKLSPSKTEQVVVSQGGNITTRPVLVSCGTTTSERNNAQRKKKLGLAEYKKRRQGGMQLNSSSSSSTTTSPSSSPKQEDEGVRLLKHQEKLKKMAAEVLKARPKSETCEAHATPAPVSNIPVIVKLPPNMEMKVFVSCGVNTDFKICKNLDPVVPVQSLEEIKPLLKKAVHKFNSNSLITSVIETIPKVLNNTTTTGVQNASSSAEHGENKTIMYLPKDRKPVRSKTVGVQTKITTLQQVKEQYVRLNLSNTTHQPNGTSSKSKSLLRIRTNSNSSTASHSTSSSGSSRTDSYSRSTSISPSRNSSRDYEAKYREVEERRVIYIGGIAYEVTKEDLRARFEKFGPISNVGLHFRNHSPLDNYGFVTFKYREDAFQALEHGNDDPNEPRYDLSFGGRRQFCKTSYADLDDMREDDGYYPAPESSFDALLRAAQQTIRRRKF